MLCWGYGGILSLGQGVFFGLGGYCMAMFLKLEASDPASTKIQTTPGIPDFMDWNQLTALPWFWEPFHSLPFALIAVVLVPTLLAWLIGSPCSSAGSAACISRSSPRPSPPSSPSSSSASRATPAASTASPICAPCSAGTSAPTPPSGCCTSSPARCCSA
ncbi:MAG: hypothetical protein MPW14_19985 [Candidatus Manganitrophus sp.]|nr:MAG: hypothetical protein MPW14_19985 [Candidatus Manganitrophus sp.]